MPLRRGAPDRQAGGRLSTAGRRLLLVHAHPDDETLTCGATIARYAAEAAAVTLVTCTLGEEGEVIPPDLRHLAGDALAEHRAGELSAALAALGVSDGRLLGGPGRFRDSGMAGTPSVEDPRAFARADLLVAADLLVQVLREVRPQVLVTYDPYGGYGHPDHVQAHRVATYSAALAAVVSHRPDLGPPWAVAKVYWTARSHSGVRASAAAVAAGGSGLVAEDDLTYAVPDEAVTCVIDASAHLPAKIAALRAHATQVSVVGGAWGLSNGRGVRLDGVEQFRLAAGVAAPGPDGREHDLFAGLR